MTVHPHFVGETSSVCTPSIHTSTSTDEHAETLLASEDSQDWVRISEMFLGPAPEQWSFTPKHKSNAYESQG